jgi:hypothetical protein
MVGKSIVLNRRFGNNLPTVRAFFVVLSCAAEVVETSPSLGVLNCTKVRFPRAYRSLSHV